MAKRLKTDDEIDEFIAIVIEQADHHANNVKNIIKPLADEVRARLNLAIDKVDVYERNGNLARTCWITISGRRYVFSYNYKSGQIVLRDKSTQGKQLHSFDNETTPLEIQQVIGNL